jgi:uncharacterized damage-inducible protein DinB
MKIDDIRFMYEYNSWANRLIMSMAEQVSVEQLRQPDNVSFGSLFGTLVHTFDAEYSWRFLLQQRLMVPEIKPEEIADLATLRTRWDAEEREMAAYVNSLTDDDMSSIITYEVEAGTRNRVLWHCLWHVVNHGMQHRSECAVMLTDFGKSPGDLDVTRFLNER